MSNYEDMIRLILEADDPKSKVKTAEISGIDFDVEDPTSKGDVAVSPEKTKREPVQIKAKSRNQARTAASAARIDPSAAETFRDFMRNAPMDDREIDFDFEDGMPDAPPEPQNLPAVVPLYDLPARIDDDVDVGFTPNISWYELRHLPGYFLSQIRGAFRPLFRDMLGADLEEIKVATNLIPQQSGGTGIRSLRALIGYLGRHGVNDGDIALEAFGIDPEMYHVDRAYVIDCDGHKFLVMRERRGGIEESYYVYVAEGKGRGTKIASDNNTTARIGRG
jgi:hypothetical protein